MLTLPRAATLPHFPTGRGWASGSSLCRAVYVASHRVILSAMRVILSVIWTVAWFLARISSQRHLDCPESLAPEVLSHPRLGVQ